MKTCKSVGCCKSLNNWFLQPCSHTGGAGTWLCFCTPLRTQDCMVPEQVPAAVHHSRLCMMHPDISECFPVIKYAYDTRAESHYYPLFWWEQGFFFSPYFFLLSQSKGRTLKIPLLNSSTEKRKFGLELVYWAIVSAFILLSSGLKCVSTSTLALKSLYVALVTLGSLEVLLPASPDHKALVEYLY